MIPHFHSANTKGLDAADLTALNRAWAEIHFILDDMRPFKVLGATDDPPDGDPDWTNQVREDMTRRLLLLYGQGARGDDLVAWIFHEQEEP